MIHWWDPLGPMVMISISFFVFCSPSTLNTVAFKAAKGGSLQQPGYTLRLISMKTVQNNWEMVGHWSWYVSFSHPFSLWLVSNTWATPVECLQHGLTVPNRPIICQNEHWSCRPFWLLLAPRSIGAFICFLNRKTPPSGHWPWGNSGSKPESQMASHVLFPQFSDKQTDHSRIIPWNPMESHGIPASPGLHVGFWLHAMDWWCRVRRMGVEKPTGEWSLNGVDFEGTLFRFGVSSRMLTLFILVLQQTERLWTCDLSDLWVPTCSNMFQQSQKTCLVNLGHHGIIVGSI